MKVRVIRRCAQPLEPGGPHPFLDLGDEVEWNCEGELPPCFEEVEEPDSADQTVAAETPPSAAPPILHALDRDSQIIMAFDRMDHSSSEQWTAQQLPRVEVVSYILHGLGFDPEVTRAELQVARPGFARE